MNFASVLNGRRLAPWFVAAAWSICLAPAALAGAPARPKAPDVRFTPVDWPLDVALTAGLLATSATFDALVEPSLTAAPTCPLAVNGACDRGTLWRGDRASLRFHDAPWRRTSDVLQWATVLLGAGAVGLDAGLSLRGLGAAPIVGELLVFLESVAVATATTAALKVVVRRPRPINYRERAREPLDLRQSFPSGHTTAAAAAASSAVTLLATRHGGGAFWSLGVGAGALLTAATASGRVLGGQHFVSDVLAGALIGAAAGIVTPRLHGTRIRVRASALPEGGAFGAVGLSL